MAYQLTTHHIGENGDDAYADPSRHGSEIERLTEEKADDVNHNGVCLDDDGMEQKEEADEGSDTVVNVLWTEAAQRVLDQKYLPVVVKTAIDAIFREQGANVEFSAQDILEEIEKHKRRDNVTDTSLKVPSFPENKRNEATPKEPEELHKQNDEMRKMKLCKSCGAVDGNYAIVNCGHLICNECRLQKSVCSFCEQEIKRVIPIHFTEKSLFE